MLQLVFFKNLEVRTQILVSCSCSALWHKTPPSLVELDKNLQLTTYISLKACIPLRVGNESFHPVCNIPDVSTCNLALNKLIQANGSSNKWKHFGYTLKP